MIAHVAGGLAGRQVGVTEQYHKKSWGGSNIKKKDIQPLNKMTKSFNGRAITQIDLNLLPQCAITAPGQGDKQRYQNNGSRL